MRSAPSVFAWLFTGGLAWGVAAPAGATAIEDELGLGPRVQGIGGAGTALADDFSAVYYNPARLNECPGTQLSAGYDYVQYKLRLNDEDPYPRKERLRPLNRYYVGVCARLPFGIGLGFVFGQGLEHPAFFSQTTTDDQPRFVRYGQRLEALTVMAALSYEIIDSLSVGAGIALLVDSNVAVSTNLALFEDESETPFSYGWEFGRSIAAHVGIDWAPMQELHLGLTYRSLISHRLDGAVEAGLRADVLLVEGNVELLVDGVSWFTPHQVALGASYVFDEMWTFAMDLTWYHWSEYAGPFVDLELRIDDQLQGIVDVVPTEAEESNFSDIVAPRFGVEYADAERGWAVRGGYAFRPTPAPLPDRRANVLDGEGHVFTLGGGYALDLSLFGAEGEGWSLSADAAFSLMFMPDRVVTKATARPRLNDYSFGGFYFGFASSLSLSF